MARCCQKHSVRSRPPLSKVTVKQAASLTGKSRETINTATNSGLLSFSLNSRNHKVLDVAELERVFPLVKTMGELRQQSEPVSSSQKPSEPDSDTELLLLQEKLSSSEQLREMLADERDRERRQFEAELETLRNSLEKSQEQHNKALLLITDQSQNSQDKHSTWEQTIRQLESKIANQAADFEKRVGEVKQAGFREAQDLPWYQLLFKKKLDVP